LGSNASSIEGTYGIVNLSQTSNYIKVEFQGSTKRVVLTVEESGTATEIAWVDASGWLADEWHQVTFTWDLDLESDFTGRYQLYVDGVKAAYTYISVGVEPDAEILFVAPSDSLVGYTTSVSVGTMTDGVLSDMTEQFTYESGMFVAGSDIILEDSYISLSANTDGDLTVFQKDTVTHTSELLDTTKVYGALVYPGNLIASDGDSRVVVVTTAKGEGIKIYISTDKGASFASAIVLDYLYNLLGEDYAAYTNWEDEYWAMMIASNTSICYNNQKNLFYLLIPYEVDNDTHLLLVSSSTGVNWTLVKDWNFGPPHDTVPPLLGNVSIDSYGDDIQIVIFAPSFWTGIEQENTIFHYYSVNAGVSFTEVTLFQSSYDYNGYCFIKTYDGETCLAYTKDWIVDEVLVGSENHIIKTANNTDWTDVLVVYTIKPEGGPM
jgi:hypothetical protein